MMKSPVMEMGYGATPHGQAKALREYLKEERLWKGSLPLKVCQYLHAIIKQEIEKREAPGVMEWLKDVATMLAKEGQAITWTTPNGSVITQSYLYPVTAQKRIAGVNRWRHEGEWTKEFRPKQKTAFAPNFIHSLDATAMAETVRACARQGVTSFAMIHDSFATTAAQTDTLHRTTLDVLATMYEQHDPLGDLHAWAWPQSPVKDHQHTLRKPPVPAEGDRLELAEVRQAIFAFGG